MDWAAKVCTFCLILFWIPSNHRLTLCFTIHPAVRQQQTTSPSHSVVTFMARKDVVTTVATSTPSSSSVKRRTTRTSSSSAVTKAADAKNNTSAAASAKFQARLQEMHDRANRGENLMQSFCDSVLAQCVALDEWDSVLDVLDVMKTQNLVQQHSTYRACLQACFEVANGASAEAIFHAMQQAGVVADPIDVSLVSAAMCRNQITDSQQQQWWKRALNMLQTTRSFENETAVVPVEAYDAVISCLPPKQWKEALKLLNLMEHKAQHHPKPSVSTYRTVIEICVANHQAEQAFQLLMGMQQKGLKPTVYTFELVISALAKKLQWRRALQLLDVMDELEIPKTVVTYNTVISACARAGEVGTAKHLLAKMRKQGVQPNIISFNSVMSACAGTSRWKDALSVLDQCHREPGVQPDIITYTNAMRACARGRQTNRALTLLQVVKDKKLPIDNYCYTAVIDACAKARMWRKALELLDEMEQNGIVANEITYSVAINACGNGGQWERALALLDKMREKNMNINLITYNSAITALSKASRRNAKYSSKVNTNSRPKTKKDSNVDRDQLWVRALELIEQIKADGLEPDGFSYSAAISCCGAGGRWKEALALIKTMQKGGPKTRPNKVAYTAAISACGRSGEYQHALQLFTDMKEQGLQPDRVAYNALFSALRVAKMPDEAFELWGEMTGRSERNSTSLATARAPASVSPDIITLTDVIATLDDNKKVDQVFQDAVDRGIVLRSGSLDSDWEVDLAGMSFPVARAACRFLLRRILAAARQDELPSDLTLITGVGRGQRMGDISDEPRDNGPKLKERQQGNQRASALREYVMQVLKEDFDPPLRGTVPMRAQGTVVVAKEQVEAWISHQ